MTIEYARGEIASEPGVEPGLPILYWPDRSICEPAFMYFAWLLETRRMGVSSMRSVASVLREWLTFCIAKRLPWDKPLDENLARWRDELLKDRTDEAGWKHRVEFRLATVFRFYSALHRACPFLEDGNRRAPLVAPEGADTVDIIAALTAKRVGSALVWSRSDGTAGVQMRRPTPDFFQVHEVLTRLRSGVSRSEKGNKAWKATIVADRDWLAGRLMAAGGLRAAEVSSLSLDHILDMLARAELQVPASRLSGAHPLDALSSDRTGRDGLMGSLEALSASFRTSLDLRIVGKGCKERLIPIPIDLVRDVLEVGVWSVRRQQIGKNGLGPQYAGETPWLMLSEKTGKRLSAGAICDIIAAAFDRAPAIPGSGHRLRAHFATTTAIRIFGACLQRTGGRETPGTVETAYVELAGALGHRRITTTVRFYIQVARLHYIQAVPRHDGLAEAILAEVAKRGGCLSAARMKLTLRTISAILDAEEGSETIGLLGLIVKEAERARVPALPVAA